MGHQASCYDDDDRSALVEGGDAPEKRAASEYDRATSSRLVFARGRVFKPHTRTRLQDIYQQDKLIGQGSHGQVFKAAASSAQGNAESWLNSRQVAVKCFVLGGGPTTLRTQQDVLNRANAKASFERERLMLAQLEHPHIVKMFECFEERDYLFIVMEVCHGGELYEYVASSVNRGHPVGLDQGLVFFRQMLHATGYLHARKLLHRDLKTENFLLLGAPGSPDANVVKLCDFGSATLLDRFQPRAMDVIGTLSYTAPEVYREQGATFSADDWSLGVCLYVLLVGASPFRVTGEENQQDTIMRIIKGDFERGRPQWTMLPGEAQDLVRSLLKVDERLRLTCVQALEHPWVARGGRQRRAQGRAARPSPARGANVSPQRSRASVQEFAPYAACLFQHLAQFASLDMMQRIALNICAQLTPETEVIDSCMPLPWYKLFFALDVDLDGRLSRDELLGGLGQFPGHGYSEEELDHFLYAVDVDGSGSVEWVEWVALSLLSAEGLLEVGEPLRTAFRLLDRPSGDGRVGAADLLALVETEGSSVGEQPEPQEVCSQASLLLSKWATRGSGQPASSRSGACLGLADLRLLLEEAAMDGGGAELTEDASDWRGAKASLLCCTSGCAVEGCKELVDQPLRLFREPTFGSDMSENASPRSAS